MKVPTFSGSLHLPGKCDVEHCPYPARELDTLCIVHAQDRQGRDLPNAPSSEGLRFNQGKPRWDLIPPEALFALAKLYERGSQKYSERNWEKGMAWGKCFSSAMNHAWKFWRGEEIDEETQTHHLICAAWNLIALFTYSKRKIGSDDRLIPTEETK